MHNNYDPIARNYDLLSRLIFGQNLVRSQTCLLTHIPAGSSILIVGGGTGWILEEIAKIHSSGLAITYVEISEKMTKMAKSRFISDNKVTFVNKPIEEYQTTELYDTILTPFLFDNFQAEKAEAVFSRLNSILNLNGKWLFADFHIDQQSKFWQKPLLSIMLHFFRVICNIEARNLFPMQPVFHKNNFKTIQDFRHFHGFIKSSVYVKNNDLIMQEFK